MVNHAKTIVGGATLITLAVPSTKTLGRGATFQTTEIVAPLIT